MMNDFTCGMYKKKKPCRACIISILNIVDDVFTLVTLFSLSCLFPEIEFLKKDENF